MRTSMVWHVQSRGYLRIGNLAYFLAQKWWEPDELRGSCPVLRGAGAEMPRSTHPYLLSTIRGQYFYLYLFLDIFSRKIVGYEVYAEQSAEVVFKAYSAEGVKPGEVTLHADNGGPMKGSTMLAKLELLGVAPSFSRPSVSDDNPYSEALFRTLKYRPEYPSKPFKDIEEARTWVSGFVNWYNTIHQHSSISFVTPETRHKGEDQAILESRKAVYELAKEKNPSRWSGKTRKWEFMETVYLNRKPNKASALAA